MSTIKKVAKEAGVSTATVSRVLNGNYPVSKDAYEKVMSAVKKTGYKGNAIAKSLKMNRTFMVGLVVPDISNTYFMEIAKGIEEVISSHGYTLTICSTDEIKDKEKKVLELLNNKRLDAVVLAPCHQDKDTIQEFIDDGLKLIIIDSKISGLNVNYIGEDNYNNTRKLLEFAINRGHKDIAIVNGDIQMGTAIERFKAFKDVMKDNDLEVKDSYVLDGGYHSQMAFEKVSELLNSEDKNPSLIYAANNKMAEGVLRAIKSKNLRIPEDVSLVSYGDISLPELVEPSLTVIKQEPKKIGLETGDTLVEMLVNKSEKMNEKIIELDLKQGNSVKSNG